MNKNSRNNKGAEGSDAKELGRFGEISAARYLTLRGYRIVALNFQTPIGRNRNGVAMTGEVDIIALKSGTLCFVEVKTRRGNRYAPEISVTPRKKRQIARTANAFMREFEIPKFPRRFDVISIVASGNGAPEIKHIENHWVP